MGAAGRLGVGGLRMLWRPEAERETWDCDSRVLTWQRSQGHGPSSGWM